MNNQTAPKNASMASGGGGGGADSQSTAQVLASGSQDIAALAGLFATDGVETNALATEAGYGTVISSTLSILGVLGLVKSSIKMALGPERCVKSGWRAEPLRGIFGYAPNESDRATGVHVHECWHVEVEFKTEYVRATRNLRRFDTDKIPQIDVGKEDYGGGAEVLAEELVLPVEPREKVTVFNLGNLLHERSYTQNLSIILIWAFLSSGVTAWLIMLVPIPNLKGSWYFWMGTLIFHLSMMVMIAPPLLHAWLTNRPASYLTPRTLDVLTRNYNFATDHLPGRFSFLRRRFNTGHQVLHFRGHVPNFKSIPFKMMMMVAAALCAVGYVCQYALLKDTDELHAGVWIGCQAALALIRSIFWIVDPPWDDPKTTQAELIAIPNAMFDELSLMTTLTAFMEDDDPNLKELIIPMWAFKYTQKEDMSLGKIVQEAKKASRELERVPPVTHQKWLTLHTQNPHFPERTLDELLRYHSADDVFEPLTEMFEPFVVRLALQHEGGDKVVPSIIARVLLPDESRHERPGHWILWPKEDSFREWANETETEGEHPAWTRRKGFLDFDGGVRPGNRHRRFMRREDDEAEGGGQPVPKESMVQFHVHDFEATEQKRQKQEWIIDVNLTKIPVPRSYRLSRSVEKEKKHMMEPTEWVQECRDAFAKEVDQNFAVEFATPSLALAFVREYIGWDSEVSSVNWVRRYERIRRFAGARGLTEEGKSKRKSDWIERRFDNRIIPRNSEGRRALPLLDELGADKIQLRALMAFESEGEAADSNSRSGSSRQQGSLQGDDGDAWAADVEKGGSSSVRDAQGGGRGGGPRMRRAKTTPQ